MNWTHKFTIAGWNDNWYLVDIENPHIVAPEWDESALCKTSGTDWLTQYRGLKGFKLEELNFSLENE